MGHFYEKDGRTRFDAGPAKAKKEGLLFSVNEQFKLLAKPGLEAWKDNELAKAAYSLPPAEGETEQDYCKRVKSARYARTMGASDLGTSVHKCIENVLLDETKLDCIAEKFLPYVRPAVEYIWEKKFEIEHIEKVVVSEEHTFAGTCDLIGKTQNGSPFIGDWKTKKSVPDKPFVPYPENLWQIASYAVAHHGEEAVEAGKIWGVNLFISSTEVIDGNARFEAYSYKPEQVKEAWQTAKLLFELHRKVHEYDPRS